MPAAPWWAFLVPAAVEVVKEIIGAVRSGTEKSARNVSNRAKKKHKEHVERQNMTDYNVPSEEIQE